MNTTALPLLGAKELVRPVIDDLAHARWADVSARFDARMRDGLTEEGLADALARMCLTKLAVAGDRQRRSSSEGRFLRGQRLGQSAQMHPGA